MKKIIMLFAVSCCLLGFFTKANAEEGGEGTFLVLSRILADTINQLFSQRNNEYRYNMQQNQSKGDTLPWVTKGNEIYFTTGSIKAFLLKGNDVDTIDSCGFTMLYEAACGDDVNVVSLLLKQGANVNFRYRDTGCGNEYHNGTTPLHNAVKCGNEEIVKLLISYGADVNAVNSQGETPLMQASSGSSKLVEILLDNGADLNKRVSSGSSEGATLLHSAAQAGNYDLIKSLLSKGFNINAKDNKGYTPLHYTIYGYYIAQHSNTDFIDEEEREASLENIKDSAAYLISQGADVNAKGKDGATPLALSVSGGTNEITKILISNGAKTN